MDSPLSLKATARIVIRRKLGPASLAPLTVTRRQLRLPRELHAYLYLGDVVSSTSSTALRGNFDWLDEEEEEKHPVEIGNTKAYANDSLGQEVDIMEERRNISEE